MKRRRIIFTMLLPLALLAGGAAPAAEPPAADAFAVLDTLSVAEERVTLDMGEVELLDAIKELSKPLKIEVSIKRVSPHTKIRAVWQDKTVKEVLVDLARQAALSYDVPSPSHLIIKPR